MYEAAEAELEWFFLQRPKALGYKSQSFEGGGQSIWDDFKIHTEHMRRRAAPYRRALEREQTVTPTMGRLLSASLEIAKAAFMGGGWTFALQREFMLRGHAGSLVRVALLVPGDEFEAIAKSMKLTTLDDNSEREAARARINALPDSEWIDANERYMKNAPPVRRGLARLDLLERVVAASGGQRDERGALLQRVRKLDALRKRAIALYDGVREEYEQLRRARVGAEAQAREARRKQHEENNAALLAAHRARLRGAT